MTPPRRSVPIDRVLHVLAEHGVEIVHDYRPGVIRLQRSAGWLGVCAVFMMNRPHISPLVIDHISGLLRIDLKEWEGEYRSE